MYLTNTIKPPLFSVMSSIYELIILIYRFKVTLIFFSYSCVVVDASIRGPIYLLNMLSIISYLFQNTFCRNIFCFLQKYNFPQIATKYILWSIEENENASMKYRINLKHIQKHLLMAILTQRVEK